MRTIRIDAPIGTEPGEISARWFRSQLPTDGSPVRVIFHSEGGSVFEAFAIHDAIQAYRGRKTASVESMAFSAASLLLCAFDETTISPNGYVMLHAPHLDGREASGSERALLANLRRRLIDIYASKTRQPVATITRLIDAETFFDAEASVSLGLVDRVLSSRATITARAVPARVLARLSTSTTMNAKARWQAAVRACGSVRLADRKHPGLRLAMLAEVNRR